MPLDHTDDKSTLVQVMAWCRQATSHYRSQCWPRSMSPYDVTRSQWVNASHNIPSSTITSHIKQESTNLSTKISIDNLNISVKHHPFITMYISHITRSSPPHRNRWGHLFDTICEFFVFGENVRCVRLIRIISAVTYRFLCPWCF